MSKKSSAITVILFAAGLFGVAFWLSSLGTPAPTNPSPTPPKAASDTRAINTAQPALAPYEYSNAGLDPPEDIAGSKPPLFKPSMPPSWTRHQMQVATQAMNVLFDKCPNLSTWMPDMWKIDIHVDKSIPQTVDYDRKLFAPMGWVNPLVVSIITVPKPHSHIFADGGTVVDFYLGAGKRTGIFIQGGFFPIAACGGKPTYTFRTELDRSYDKTEAPDTFIAAPALKILKNFQPHGTNPI